MIRINQLNIVVVQIIVVVNYKRCLNDTTTPLIFTDKINYYRQGIRIDRDTIGLLDKVVNYSLFINMYNIIIINSNGTRI